MSVRLWQLAAFAYVLVLMLVALEVPLNLNLSRRVDAADGVDCLLYTSDAADEL